MSPKKVAVDDILDTFNSDDVKLDSASKPNLIIHRGALKEAVSPMDNKGIKLVRDVGKKLGARLRIDDIKTKIIPEIEGLAWDYDTPKITLAIRYAKSDDGKSVIVDLANDKNQVVEVKAGSVQILDTPPASNENVYFVRPDYLKPMATPLLLDGDERKALNKLRPFINTDDKTFFNLIGYITYVMSHPRSCQLPYPILMIQGEKGSGKSFFCNNVIRNLIDPLLLDGLRMPKREDDFVLQLNSMYLAVFDNMRSVTKDQSDLLCRASTRAASAKRTLFTTTGLTGLSLHSPMVLNGIHDFVKESDLADRCLRIRLVPMATNKRRSEQDLRAELEAVLPEILGALLTLSSKVMKELSLMEVSHSSRMMDYVLWLAGIEKVWSMPEGLLQKAYRANVRELMADGMVDDSLTLSLQKLVSKVGKGKIWKGTPSDLLDTLQELENPMYLPKAPGALSAKLFGQESSLNANGIFIKKGRGAERYVAVSDHQI
ncbi:ATP-binding protein [Vibrio cyclitrophicus]|uniref:hypothetical protein n=1 Tax=Vibrio TaxID=662 RepID=UPI0002D81689|nr:hypothetical protein [Vibrio cyclitrophicus]OCH50817.1 ATP-binding protein [Vibrio cyclitrophicus]